MVKRSCINTTRLKKLKLRASKIILKCVYRFTDIKSNNISVITAATVTTSFLTCLHKQPELNMLQVVGSSVFTTDQV